MFGQFTTITHTDFRANKRSFEVRSDGIYKVIKEYGGENCDELIATMSEMVLPKETLMEALKVWEGKE